MGPGPDFGGKPDSLTAGRSFSHTESRQMATGSLTPLARRAPLRHDSENILYYPLILTLSPQNSQPLFHLTAQTLRNTENSFQLKPGV